MDIKVKFRIKQSVSPWCFDPMTLDTLCNAVKNMGIDGVDLCGPKDWPTLRKYGLESSMCNGAEIDLAHGFNNTDHHDQLVRNYTEMIPIVAKNGFTNLICFSGNRGIHDDETGLIYCVKALQKLVPIAERHRVILCMELLNSRYDHPGYQCDRTEWGVRLVDRLGSANLKLLYDIYHMQIMEGDIINTIKKYHTYIAHYHTAGVPGRNEINAAQELNYPAIMNAIVETGYKGFIGQEFVPKDPNMIASLREAIAICDV